MATKEKLKTRAARLREEARETGKVVLRAPVLVRLAECMIRFLLGALLAGAEIFGGYAPFGIGLVGASGSGLDGFCALLGVCFGYLAMEGLAEGLLLIWIGCLLLTVFAGTSGGIALLHQIEKSAWLSFLYDNNFLMHIAMGILHGKL